MTKDEGDGDGDRMARAGMAIAPVDTFLMHLRRVGHSAETSPSSYYREMCAYMGVEE